MPWDAGVEITVVISAEDRLKVLFIQQSPLNYKDALTITGKGKIIHQFPMVPGIDFAGIVKPSTDAKFQVGQQVLLTGWGVGENH